MPRVSGVLLLGLVLLLPACGTSTPTVTPRPRPATRAEPFPYREKEPTPGLQNVIHLNEQILSGSEPHGEQGFATLARLGVKTVVSVDGARPCLEIAKQNGLRYVHIPIGYDGVPRKAGDALAQLVRTGEGPFYIHCHHGQHRGPAAAAVACIAAGEMTGPDGVAYLTLAGTGKEYAGLWRDVAAYQPPPADAELPALVEEAKVDSLAAAMAKLDRHWDNLKRCADAGMKTPADHPDLDPKQEVLLIRETLQEAGRLQGNRFDEPFRRQLESAMEVARQLEADLDKGDVPSARGRMKPLETSCKQCHAVYRN